ncbi:MAG: hypothetical protein ABDK87_05320 [Atribacterota bacterium]
MKFAFFFLSMLSMAIFGCLPQNEIPPKVLCGELSLWVGQKVVVTGCLKFSCPSFVDAYFPEDCVPYLRDESGVAYLEFAEQTEYIREKLNAYYGESFVKCVLLSALGRVGEGVCGVPGCKPWVFLEVEKVWSAEEERENSLSNR